MSAFVYSNSDSNGLPVFNRAAAFDVLRCLDVLSPAYGQPSAPVSLAAPHVLVERLADATRGGELHR